MLAKKNYDLMSEFREKYYLKKFKIRLFPQGTTFSKIVSEMRKSNFKLEHTTKPSLTRKKTL